ncbi:MAG: hypothetical protein JO064_04655 [Actinobacteria bacterium]|nr:hypothetical protein [Actinomycetota bacterium]MBV8598107.1 hypothetical protein [Actinomycetota bacterium]
MPRIVLLAALAAAVVAAGASAATPATSQQCPPIQGPRWVYPGVIRMSSTKYESFSTGYSCAKARAITARLLTRTLKQASVGAETSLGKVSGFACVGFPDKNQHAYAGVCSIRAKSIEFGWNINVLAGAATQVLNSEDASRVHQGGSDADTVVQNVSPGHYRLLIDNTSGIGYIKGFTWAPPPGWTITAVTKTSGGSCHVGAGGAIVCNGKLRPPKCLCTQSGGVASIDFTANTGRPKKVNGHPVIYGAVQGTLTITEMEPVPYIVPSTLEQLKNGGL